MPQRMILFSCLTFLAACVALPASVKAGLVIDVTTDAENYSVGDTVNWRVEFSVSDSTAATNFGLSNIAVNLRDSLGEQLSPGLINSASFPGYFLSPGTFDSNTRTLLEISATKFVQAPDAVAKHGDNLLKILLATGSYTVNTVGMHTLTATAGSSNERFTAVGQLTGAGQQYTPISFNSASFTAVPEPTSFAILGFGLSCMGVTYRRRRSP